MLRSVTARGFAPNEESCFGGRFKPLMAVSILALAGAVTIGPAQAADLYGPRDGVVDSRDDFFDRGVFNWSGLYFGGHVGGAWGDVDWTVNEAPFAPLLGQCASRMRRRQRWRHLQGRP
jgi:hypothetical protein